VPENSGNDPGPKFKYPLIDPAEEYGYPVNSETAAYAGLLFDELDNAAQVAKVEPVVRAYMDNRAPPDSVINILALRFLPNANNEGFTVGL
jgi:hypothetical protein